MITSQNSASQYTNFRRRGLVWKSVAILFSLQCKKSSYAWNIDITMSRNLNWIIKKIMLCICFAGPSSTGCENCIAVWLPWLYQIFRETSTIVIVVTNKVATSPSNYDVKTFEIYWLISVHHCWKCEKGLSLYMSSYNDAVIQCHYIKIVWPTLHNILAGTSKIMMTSMSTMHFLLNNCQFQRGQNPIKNGHMIIRIVHSWSAMFSIQWFC